MRKRELVPELYHLRRMVQSEREEEDECDESMRFLQRFPCMVPTLGFAAPNAHFAALCACFKNISSRQCHGIIGPKVHYGPQHQHPHQSRRIYEKAV